MNSESDEITKEKWRDLLASGRPQIYPSECVIRWVFGNFPRANAGKTTILDLGSGSGRHSIFMAKNGYNVIASDIAQDALTDIEKIAKADGLKISYDHAPAEAQNTKDNSIDGLVSFGVLYYLSMENMQKAAAEIHRMLKPGGKAFIMMKNSNDIRTKIGKKLNENSYLIDTSDEANSWHSEHGMCLTLLDKNAIKNLFEDFSTVTIDEEQYTTQGGEVVEASWHIYLVK